MGVKTGMIVLIGQDDKLPEVTETPNIDFLADWATGWYQDDIHTMMHSQWQDDTKVIKTSCLKPKWGSWDSRRVFVPGSDGTGGGDILGGGRRQRVQKI